MDMELQIEPIVSKAEIWELACLHADAGDQTPHRNPHPPATQAHHTYEVYFWQRRRWLDGEETS